MLTKAKSYNFIGSPISGLWRMSARLAGKDCYLGRDGKLVYYKFDSINQRDISREVPKLGRMLAGSSNLLPPLVQITFPKDPAQVREFFRFTIRTAVPIYRAAALTGVKIENLGGYAPKI